MKAVLNNGLWALLVIGAYLVGTMRRPDPGPPPESLVIGEESKVRRPVQRGLDSAKGGSAAVDRGEGSDAWLDSILGDDLVISATRMEEAVAAVLLESDPVTATLHFAQLLEELSPENAPAILQALKDNGGSGRASEYLELLAHAWGRLDGKAAAEAFDTLRGRGSEAAKTAALAAWAAEDPAAATEWLQQRVASADPNADRRANTAWSRGLLTGLARRDVDGALQYLLTLGVAEQRDYVGVLVEEKLREGVVASADWALRLPDEPMRIDALETVGMEFLRQDLDGALQWARSIADRPDAHEAVADVADAMATRDPAEAVAWVAGLPAGPSQDHAYEDLFENWTRTDPVAAGQSLTRMETGTARDTAIQAFSRTVARESPEDALVWAGAITDSEQRANVQVEIARRWQRSSPDEAATWIGANLPADIQARVLPPAP